MKTYYIRCNVAAARRRATCRALNVPAQLYRYKLKALNTHLFCKKQTCYHLAILFVSLWYLLVYGNAQLLWSTNPHKIFKLCIKKQKKSFKKKLRHRKKVKNYTESHFCTFEINEGFRNFIIIIFLTFSVISLMHMIR